MGFQLLSSFSSGWWFQPLLMYGIIGIFQISWPSSYRSTYLRYRPSPAAPISKWFHGLSFLTSCNSHFLFPNLSLMALQPIANQYCQLGPSGAPAFLGQSSFKRQLFLPYTQFDLTEEMQRQNLTEVKTKFLYFLQPQTFGAGFMSLCRHLDLNPGWPLMPYTKMAKSQEKHPY